MYSYGKESQVSSSSSYSNPAIFWKAVNSKNKSSSMTSLAFNKHFTAAGHLLKNGELDLSPVDDKMFSVPSSQQFALHLISLSVVKDALPANDPRKCTREDNLDPLFLNLSYYIILDHKRHIFNLSLSHGTVPRDCKMAYVIHPFTKKVTKTVQTAIYQYPNGRVS